MTPQVFAQATVSAVGIRGEGRMLGVERGLNTSKWIWKAGSRREESGAQGPGLG